MRFTRNLLRRPVIVIAIGLLLGAGLVVGTRLITTALLGHGDTAIGIGTDEVAVATTNTTTTGTTEGRGKPASPLPSPATTSPAPSTTQAPSEDPAGDGLTIGKATITPRQPVDFRDRVTVHPAAVMDFPSFPTEASTDASAGPDTGPVDPANVTNGEAAPLPRAFNVGVLVEPESHLAVIRVGIDAGSGGLSALSIDFGDGEVHEVSQDRIDQVGEVGTIEIIHRYEPTLTPQPQEVKATAKDGAGTVKVATARFETQALFLLGYSPLTITALDDCDLFGKGDFVLQWNNDGRDRTSRFDLAKGDIYEEEEFRVGLQVRYGDESRSWITIEEKDSTVQDLVRFGYFNYGGLGNAPTELFANVAELGTHTVPISLEHNIRPGCDVLAAFVVTLALSEREPR